MNIKQFNHLVNATDQRIREDETKQLQSLVNTFPYCQTGHLLLSKACKEQGSMTSEMKIKTASAYSINRRHLKRFLLEKVTSMQVLGELPEVVEQEDIFVEAETIDDVIVVELAEESEVNQTLNKSSEVVGSSVSSIAVGIAINNNSVSDVEDKIDKVKDGLEEVKGLDQIIEPTPIVVTGYEHVHLEQELTIAEEIHKSLEELRRLKEKNKIGESEKQVDLVDQEVKSKEHLVLAEDLIETLDVKEQSVNTLDSNIEKGKGPVILVEKKIKEKPINIKEKLKALSKKVKADGEKKIHRAKKKQGEIFHHQPNEDLIDSRLGESGGEKENSEADLILKYLESLDKKKTRRASKKSQGVILDAFIKNEPQISRVKAKRSKGTEKQEDFSKSSGTLQISFVNENMAKIHAKQGNFGKAIKIYKDLMLKKPEKKSYFASQIENLKKEQ
jgi:hypothetical protein